MSKLSGFPEFLPAERNVEQVVLDELRRVFELHGFASVETRAVEPMDQLLRKGEIDKEVYVLRRYHADDGDAGIGLHFDLTVPFARYVVENAGKLQFPFRRYQIQKVWRGERPQHGRFREFTQADIDIVAKDALAFHFDVEIAQVMAAALSALPIPDVTMQISNRKVLEGFYRGLGLDDPLSIMQIIDKLDKLPEDSVHSLLSDAGLTDRQTQACLNLARINTADQHEAPLAQRVRELGVEHPLLDQGVDELEQILAGASGADGVTVVVDLRIARGLDYYTGTVFETRMTGHDGLGSICSGGRYDALAHDGRSSYPGVGISLGVSRMLAPLVADGLTSSRPVPSAALIAVTDEESRHESDAVAQALRARDVPCEVAPAAQKFGKQIRYAERRGIPYIWFLPSQGGEHQVKDVRSGEQIAADPESWVPCTSDLRPHIKEQHS